MAYEYTTSKAEAERWVRQLNEATGYQPTIFVEMSRAMPRSRRMYRVQADQVGNALMAHILDIPEHVRKFCEICTPTTY